MRLGHPRGDAWVQAQTRRDVQVYGGRESVAHAARDGWTLVPCSVAASTFCSGLSTGGLDNRVLPLASWLTGSVPDTRRARAANYPDAVSADESGREPAYHFAAAPPKPASEPPEKPSHRKLSGCRLRCLAGDIASIVADAPARRPATRRVT